MLEINYIAYRVIAGCWDLAMKLDLHITYFLYMFIISVVQCCLFERGSG